MSSASIGENVEAHKHAAAVAAAALVEEGMSVGLGTGSTVTHFLDALAGRALGGLRCVATSRTTEATARELGLPLSNLDELGGWVDIAIDGADQIDPQGWLIKGGGAAHSREKIVAAAAKRFIVIASADKLVPELSPPVPLELLPFGAAYALAALAPAQQRDVPPSPDGNLIADYLGPVGDPRAVSARLDATPGVVEHGLFPPELVSDILVAGADGVRARHSA